jgi:hypothetical protein
MAIEYLNLDDTKYIILYKELGSTDNIKVYYDGDSPITFTTEQEATEYAIARLSTKEFNVAQITKPDITIPTP